MSHVWTAAAVQLVLQHLVNLGGEGDVVVGELAPRHQQEGEGVVVEAEIAVDMCGHQTGGGQERSGQSDQPRQRDSIRVN